MFVRPIHGPNLGDFPKIEYRILFTFAEIIVKVEMASAKMSPCFTTILAQLMNKNEIGIQICFQTDVF